LKIAGSPLGSKRSEETRAKISATRKGILKSEETKAKISASISAYHSKKIEVLDLETNISTTYDSIRAAARALNCHESSIRQYFSRNQIKPYKKRYILGLRLNYKNRFLNLDIYAGL